MGNCKVTELTWKLVSALFIFSSCFTSLRENGQFIFCDDISLNNALTEIVIPVVFGVLLVSQNALQA